jgi:SAM-dependent methyltransferase
MVRAPPLVQRPAPANTLRSVAKQRRVVVAVLGLQKCGWRSVGRGCRCERNPSNAGASLPKTELMRAQRPAGAAPCVAATAESLPFEDQSFDAAMAFSTVHHWQDPIAGLREMRRVARRVVVFAGDTSETGWRRRFWLTRDYLPEVADLLVGRLR